MRSPHRVVVGAVLLLCSVQYFVVEAVAAAAWDDPSYNWIQDYISDLGAVECGPSICSPRHVVIMFSLVFHACVALVVTALLADLIAMRAARVALRGLVVVHAAGNLIVASSPLRPYEDVNGLHYLGAALAISGGIAAIGLVGAVSLCTVGRRLFGVFSLVIAGVALAGLVLVRWNATEDAGLPSGLIERTAVDPIVIWFVVTGLVLAVTVARRAARRTVPRV